MPLDMMTTTAALVRPLIVLYIRFSDPSQMAGISEDRQQHHADALSERTGKKIDLVYIDRGASGYHETHMKNEYGRLHRDIESGKIPTGSEIWVESLDRLSRADPVMASHRRTTLLVAGMTIVLTPDGKRISRFGEHAVSDLFSATGHEVGNHQASKDKSERMKRSHDNRRGTDSAIMPSWIIKERDVQSVTTVKSGKTITRTQAVVIGKSVDPVKEAILRRLGCDILLKMGFDTAATLLNREGIPTMNGRKLGRTEAVWDAASIRSIFMDRKVLGEQEICHYENRKKIRTKQYVATYPAIMSETEYFTLWNTIRERQKGTWMADARKTGQMTNLFGALAKCSECGNRMVAQTRGRGTHYYFVCSMAKAGKCKARKYHRLDAIESAALGMLGEVALSNAAIPVDDPAANLVPLLDAARMGCAKLKARRDSSNDAWHDDKTDTEKRGDFERHDGQYRESQAAVTKLEHQIAALRTAKPAVEVFGQVRRLLADMDAQTPSQTEPERIAIRQKIAAALPAIVKSLTFDPFGNFVVQMVPGLSQEAFYQWRVAVHGATAAMGAGLTGAPFQVASHGTSARTVRMIKT